MSCPTTGCVAVDSRSPTGPESEDAEDNPPRLSAHALTALQEFYAEQQATILGGEEPVIAEDWVNMAC